MWPLRLLSGAGIRTLAKGSKGLLLDLEGLVASVNSVRQVAFAGPAASPVVASFWGNQRTISGCEETVLSSTTCAVEIGSLATPLAKPFLPTVALCRQRISIRVSRRALLFWRSAVLAIHARQAANPCLTLLIGAGRQNHRRHVRLARTRDLV